MPLPRRPFIFVRHGQTDWNVEGRAQGQIDIPLNATGVEQAASICKKLMPEQVDYVISSPLSRALRTAAFIAETHQRPIHIDSRLLERSYGRYEGWLMPDIRKHLNLPETATLSSHLDGIGEPWPDVCGRTLAVINDWLQKHPQKQMVFVSHGVVFRALVEMLTGDVLRAENAKPYLFEPEGKEGWQIHAL